MSIAPKCIISIFFYVLFMAVEDSFADEKISCEVTSKIAYDIYSRVTTNAAFLKKESLSAAGEDLKIISKYSDNCEKIQEYISLLTSAVAKADSTLDVGAGVGSAYNFRGSTIRGVTGAGMSAPELDLRLNSPVMIQRRVETAPQ